MADDRFTFFRSYIEAIECLPEKQQLKVLKAIIAFGLDGKEPEGLSKMATAIFAIARPIIATRHRGGQPGNQNARRVESGNEPEDESKNEKNESKTNPSDSNNESETNRERIGNESKNEKNELLKQKHESESESEYINNKNKQNAPAPARTREEPGRPAPSRTVFKPPTIEEVTAYCRERENSVDPVAWRDFYESKGWMIGPNKMRDWKAAVRTWERNGRSGSNGNQSQNNSNSNGYGKQKNVLGLNICPDPGLSTAADYPDSF